MAKMPIGVWVNLDVNYGRPSTVNGNVPVVEIAEAFLESGATVENIARNKGIRIADVVLALRFVRTYNRVYGMRCSPIGRKGIERLAT